MIPHLDESAITARSAITFQTCKVRTLQLFKITNTNEIGMQGVMYETDWMKWENAMRESWIIEVGSMSKEMSPNKDGS